MKMNIYSVYDKAAQAFTQQFFDRNHGAVIRSFQDATKNTETDIGKHPEDYVLYYNGYFDTNSGEIQPDENTPMKLITGLDCSLKEEINITKQEYHDAIKPKEDLTVVN